MNVPSFTPKFSSIDFLGKYLESIARWSLILSIGLLPLLFLPGSLSLTLTYKPYLALFGVLAALLFGSLALLRIGKLTWYRHPLVLAWWGIVGASAVTGLIAPQTKFAFFGDTLDIHTVGFLALLGALMSLGVLFRSSRGGIIMLYGFVWCGVTLITLWHLLRVVLGADALTLGTFTTSAASPIGSLNDLALFAAMTILVSLVALFRLGLSRLYTGMFVAGILVSLAVLMLVNFFMVWLAVGLFALLLTVFSLTRQRFADAGPSTVSITVVVLSLIVFLVSAIFVVGGSALGTAVSNATGVSYLEVRPSWSATLDIAKQVFINSPFTGTGPNHFSEAWTQFKDSSINATLFWNVPFNAGNSYAATAVLGAGVFGVIAWLVFYVMLAVTGFRTLTAPRVEDELWHFIGTISFVIAAFVWGVALVYVPGSVVLIVGAMATGLLITASTQLVSRKVYSVDLLTSSRVGFVLISGVMIAIIVTIVVGYGAVRQMMMSKTYASVLTVPAGENQVDEITSRLIAAYQYYRTDTIARELALYKIAVLRVSAGTVGTSTAEVQAFFTQANDAKVMSDMAIELKPNDARNWATRGDLYTLLASIGVADAEGLARSAYDDAKKRDPQNPYYDVQQALLEIIKRDNDAARNAIGEALKKKPNYVDALTLLVQLEINAGQVDQAIAATEALANLEPQNAGRFYQLGVLYNAKGDTARAKMAFSRAIEIDPAYANARYLRALQFLAEGDTATAISELKIVRDLNPDNGIIGSLIGQIESGEVTPATVNGTAPATISEPVVTEADESLVAPDTDALAPVNTPATTTP
jgi:tetratricopeptide (TPR) repeat protein